MTSATQPAARTATPEAIVDIAIGFMGAKQLFAASRIGLFTAVADGAATVEELSNATGVPSRQVRILADSMASQGLLERNSRRYSLTPDAAAYLTGAHAELDLAPFLAFLGSTSYDQWRGYDKTVDTDAAGTLELDEGGWADFMKGVMTYNALHAEMLARHFDFTGFGSALDLGGLSPDFAIKAMQANPDLKTRFVVAPDFAEGVRQAVEAAGLGGRAVVEGAETEDAQPGGAHDLVMVNHVAHRFGAAENARILANARAAAAPGATLLMLDFYLDDDPVQRRIDALHAGEYYNIDGTVVYPESVVREWLEAAGWAFREMISLPGSPRVIVADAV
ncbi:methyltransferase dimerization domain-containing protein [Arthrobacter sp.]|uniref:methyltransferase family protein n=1 Tax=Arthrobacter sp. TaxID=1667 RepID=UPI002899D1E9|nr:methyltransferase dimerization domain-containing protein [Arthrobacter sp.]